MRRSFHLPSLVLLALPLLSGCIVAQTRRSDDRRYDDRRYDDRRESDRRSDDRDSYSRQDTPFHWSGEVDRGRWVYIRNLNGRVRVEEGTGNKVEITGVKSWRRGNPEDVRISVRQTGSGRGDLIVCALWRDRDSCDEDGYRSSNSSSFWNFNRNNDVNVEFTIKIPSGLRVNARSVNGDVTVDGATGEVVAHTTNGSVEARSTSGPVSARTTNGNIFGRSGRFEGGHTDYATTNGSITVEMPSNVNADVEMRTTNGHLSSDFPITVEGKFSTRRLNARLGSGGPLVRLSTTNGSIRLRRI